MIIVIGGRTEGEIDGKAFAAKAGQMFFAPPDLSVTFRNPPKDETLSFVWLMWGDGA